MKCCFCCLLCIFLSFPLFPLKKYSRTGFSMGTVLTVQFFTEKRNGNILLDELFALASSYERLFSSKQTYGAVYQLNQKGGGVVDSQILSLLKEADYYYRFTGGAFDYGLYHLIELWHIETAEEPPLAAEVERMRQKSGAKLVEFSDDGTLTLKNGVQIDLGAIAKGEILGLLGEYLKQNSVNHFMINGGGDIVLSGLFNGKRVWNIALKDPFSNEGTVGYMGITDRTIVTSGSYERFFMDKQGVRYHHILSPETGYPVENGVHSVTVISSDPSKSDALSTALFVMGVEKGIPFVNTLKDVQAIFIGKNSDGEVWIRCSSGISYGKDEFGSPVFHFSGEDKILE